MLHISFCYLLIAMAVFPTSARAAHTIRVFYLLFGSIGESAYTNLMFDIHNERIKSSADLKSIDFEVSGGAELIDSTLIDSTLIDSNWAEAIPSAPSSRAQRRNRIRRGNDAVSVDDNIQYAYSA